MQRNIRRETILFIIIGILLLLCPLSFIPLSNNFDELAAILLVIPIIDAVINRKYNQRDKKILVCYVLMIVLALLSNYLSGIVSTISWILNDILAFSRIFILYLGTAALLQNDKDRAKEVIRIFAVIARCFIRIAFVFGILNAVGVVTMYNAVRYGIRNYYFYFGNASIFGIYVGVAVGFLILNKEYKRIDVIMGLILLVMIAKGASLIIAAVYLLLYYFIDREIKWYQILLTCLVLGGLLSFQIKYYLFDSSAPRSILISYGALTAVRYFPFGAGFAAFGSNMAAVHYSPLYYQYGFDSIKALTYFDNGSGVTTYLNDTYIGMIFGEFGFLGTMFFVLMVYQFVKIVMSAHDEDKRLKCIGVALVMCLLGSMVMLGSIKNYSGEFLMMFLAFFSCMYSSESIDSKEERAGALSFRERLRISRKQKQLPENMKIGVDES